MKPACFSEEGPFDPDADDAVMAPAAREVGVLTPVTAAARAIPSVAAAAPRAEPSVAAPGNPSAAAPVAAPSAAAPVAAPGNDLMAAIRAFKGAANLRLRGFYGQEPKRLMRTMLVRLATRVTRLTSAAAKGIAWSAAE